MDYYLKLTEKEIKNLYKQLTPFSLIKSTKNPFLRIKYFFKGVKYFYQRVRYGICDYDVNEYFDELEKNFFKREECKKEAFIWLMENLNDLWGLNNKKELINYE